MSFFNPLNLLWLLPFAGAILALYFLRPQWRSLTVSTLFLWDQITRSARSDKPFQRLKFSLLLLLQLLAVILLVIILGAPQSPPRQEARSSFVIVLEQSASMEANDVKPSRYDVAKQEAIQFVNNNLRPGDLACILGVASSPQLICPLTSEKERLIDAISQSSAVDVALDLPEAITYAHSLCPTAAAMVLFGDGSWSPDIDNDIVRRATVPLHIVTIGTTDSSNSGIVALSERVDEGHPQSPPELLVSIDRHNSTTGKVQVLLDGAEVSSAALPGGDGNVTKVFPLPQLRRGGTVTVHLTDMARDDLAADNTSSLIVNPMSSRRILLVTDGNPYLERALALLPNVQLYEVKPSEFDEGTINFDVIVYDRWLPEKFPAAPSLVIDALGDGVPVDSAGPAIVNQQFVDWNETNRILSYTDLSTVHIKSALNVRPAVWGNVIADLQNGPGIVSGRRNGQNIVWFGFSIDDTDFPRQVAFPIILSNIVDSLGTANAGTTDCIQTGTPITLEQTPLAWLVSDPNGKTESVPCIDSGGCQYMDTDKSGIYVARSEAEVKNFACNLVSSSESDIAVKDHVGLTEMKDMSVRRAMYRVDPSPWIAAVALAVILLEWLVYHRPLRYTRSL